jgi:hypothetical protein
MANISDFTSSSIYCIQKEKEKEKRIVSTEYSGRQNRKLNKNISLS